MSINKHSRIALATLAAAAMVWLMASIAGADGPAATRPAARPDDPSVMARVRGKAIYMEELNDLLLRAHGMPVAQQLVANELVRQAAAEKSITISDADIQAENVKALDQMFGKSVTRSETEQKALLDQLLVQKSFTHQQWRMTMWRNAALRKLAEPQVKLTDAELEAEFAERHGRKVVVRHIQTTSLPRAQLLRRQLAAGGDFAKLASKHSANPSAGAGGLLPAIGVKAPGLPTAIRDAAWKLTKPGELSNPIQVGTAFHILRLERIEPAQGVKFEDVKKTLAAEVREGRVQLLQQRILGELFRQALAEGAIEFVNPVLKDQHAGQLKGSPP